MWLSLLSSPFAALKSSRMGKQLLVTLPSMLSHKSLGVFIAAEIRRIEIPSGKHTFPEYPFCRWPKIMKHRFEQTFFTFCKYLAKFRKAKEHMRSFQMRLLPLGCMVSIICSFTDLMSDSFNVNMLFLPCFLWTEKHCPRFRKNVHNQNYLEPSLFMHFWKIFPLARWNINVFRII